MLSNSGTAIPDQARNAPASGAGRNLFKEKPLFHVVLVEPEIPPNTGNIIRLCANTGAHLHLIEPLGFTLEDKDLRRAGLDYHEWAQVRTYKSFTTFIESVGPARVFAFSTRNQRLYTDAAYGDNDALLFG